MKIIIGMGITVRIHATTNSGIPVSTGYVTEHQLLLELDGPPLHQALAA